MSKKSNSAFFQTNKHKIQVILRYIVTGLAIGFIIYCYRDTLPKILDNLKTTNIPLFAFSIIAFFVGLFFIALRLKNLLLPRQINLSVWHTYYANLIALFINNIFPSALGGEVVKALYVYKKTNGKKDSFGTVFVDRLLGLVTLTLIGSVAIVFMQQKMLTPKVLSSIAFLGGVTLFAIFIIFSKTIYQKISAINLAIIPVTIQEIMKKVYESMHQYRNNKKLLLLSAGMSLTAQVFFILTSYMLARSIGINIHFGFFFFFVPILAIVMLVPSVNGIGIREAMFLFYLSEYSTPDRILAFSLLTTFHLVFIGIICGVLYGVIGGGENLKVSSR